MFLRNKTVGLIGRAFVFWLLAGWCGNGLRADTFGGFTYTTNSTRATITKYTGAGGDIIIPDVLGGKPVTRIDGKSFYVNTKLTSVFISSNVTYVGNFAFADCANLVSINVDSNNTTYCCVDGVLFNKTKTSIVQVPASRTGNYVIPSTVTGIKYAAFCGCNGLTNVTISSGATYIEGYAFSDCNGLTSIIIPSNVTNIGNEAFSDCSRLTSIIVTTNNSLYSSHNGALFNKVKTTILQFPAGIVGSYDIPAGVTNIGDSAFYRCIGLTGVTIPYGVQSIGNSGFWGCDRLADISLPSSVQSIGIVAFCNCTNLASMTIPASVTNIQERAFLDCKNMSAFTVEDTNPSYSSVDGTLFNKTKTTLIQYPCGLAGAYTIPPNVTNIGKFAFYDSKLSQVIIPSSMAVIGVDAFRICDELSRADFLGDAPSMGSGVFAYCAASFKVYYLAGKTGFTSPTWNGYPSAVLGGAAILPSGIPSGTEYEAWVLTNAAAWNAVNFTAVPAEDFERAWLLHTMPKTNLAAKTDFLVKNFTVGSDEIQVTLGLGVAAQPKAGAVNGWLAIDGRESMTNAWQTMAGQSAGQNKLSFTNGQATVLFDKPADMRFFRPRLQKDVPNSGSILPLNQTN